MPAIVYNVVSFIIQSFSLYYYMIAISQTAQNTKFDWKKKLIILATAILMIVSAIILRGKFPINTLVMSLLMFLSLAFIIKVKKSAAALIALLIPIFLGIAEILVVVIFIVAFNISPPEMINIPWMSFGIATGTTIILITALFLFSKVTANKQRIQNYIRNYNKKYLTLTFYLLLFTVMPYLILIPLNVYNYSPIFLLLNFVNVLAVSIFLYWYIANKLESEKIQEQLTTLEMDNKTLEGMVDGVRTIKHDFNNIFQAINGYLCSKQYEDLDKYVLKIMKECNIVNTLSIINKNVFDDPANYGVIGSKYFIATEQNITMDLDVTISFKQINFPMSELSRIFGVLLDNAIEATNKCDNKYIRLEIKHVPKKNATVIRLVNSFDITTKIELGNIYNKGYSSKEKKSGLGLWEAKKIISKHRHSQIYATIENDVFIQNIIIENT